MVIGMLRKILPLIILCTIIVSAAAIAFTTAPQTWRVKYVDRVIVLSIDAARADIFYALAKIGYLKGLKTIMDKGVIAEGMIVTFPSATAVSHATISTGAPPGKTGITGNRIHLPGTPIYKTVSGFSAEYLQAEPIWITVDRQGLKAVVAAFPQSTPKYWEDKVKQAILFNPYDAFLWPVSYSTLYTNNKSVPAATYIEIKPAENWTGEELVKAKKAWEAEFKLGDDTWYLYIADLDGDDKPDKVYIVPLEKDLGKALTDLREDEWSKPLNTTITYKGAKYIVAPRFKAINLSLTNFRLYRSLMRPFNVKWYNNETLAREVWNNVVVKVGMITDGDWWALTHDWIDPETYMETVYFANEFFKQFTVYLMEHTDWNLLMTYTPIIDNVFHQFLGLLDPNMPYFNPKKAEYFAKLVLEAIQWADSFIVEILNRIDLSNTVFIVISDHGQWSVKKLVYINDILYNAGLIKADEKGNILWNETKAFYVGYNQIFVNLQGREEGGVVPPEEYNKVVKQIMAALASVRDPDTGEPVFGLIMNRNETMIVGLYGDRAGDVVFSCRPGYAAWWSSKINIDPETGKAKVFVNVTPLKTVTGWHSDYPYYPELVAIFGAIGGPVIHGKLGIIMSTSVAPTIAMLLGIEPPADSVGIPLPIVAPTGGITTITKTVTQVITKTVTVTETMYKTVTKTKTVTETVTSPTTITETSYATITETVTTTKPTTITEILTSVARELITTTKTVTETVVSPTTVTKSVPYEKTVTVVEWGPTIAVAIILFIVGFAISYLIKRPR